MATGNRILSKDLYNWRVTLAIQHHFHIHFLKKDLIFAVIFEVLNVET